MHSLKKSLMENFIFLCSVKAIFAKKSIVDVWKRPKYKSEFCRILKSNKVQNLFKKKLFKAFIKWTNFKTGMVLLRNFCLFD